MSMDSNTPRSAGERKLFLAAAALIIFSFSLMGVFARTVRQADDDQFWEFTAMFSEVFRAVRERYVDEVDSKALFEGALTGLFLPLDSHSQYMDPDLYNQLEKDTEGAFSGVGIQIQIRNGVLTVVSPIPGSPAAKAGIRAWDRIIEIDGKDTRNINLLEAVKKLTGPSGTTVKVKVYREGERDYLDFELVRNNIKVESVYSRMHDDKIGYLRIARFSESTSRDLHKAIDELTQKGAKGFIVDLRYNSGGLLKEAIETSNLFLPKGKLIVSTEGRQRNQSSEFRAEKDSITDLPVVVLVNRSSASASEILAGALKDHKRAVVLGVKGHNTYGKGSVQTIEELTNSFIKDANGNYQPAAIRLTTARYLTPAGIKIDKVGVTPDIAVELPPGQEDALQEIGLFGEPISVEEDVVTSVSTFRWDKYATSTANGNGSTESVAAAPDAEQSDEETDPNAPEGLEDEEETENGDEATTKGTPKKTIPVDFALFPDAKKPEDEEKKDRVDPKTFVDYQLKVAERLLHDHIDRNLDFYSVDAGMPPAGSTPEKKDTVASAAPASNDSDASTR